VKRADRAVTDLDGVPPLWGPSDDGGPLWCGTASPRRSVSAGPSRLVSAVLRVVRLGDRRVFTASEPEGELSRARLHLGGFRIRPIPRTASSGVHRRGSRVCRGVHRSAVRPRSDRDTTIRVLEAVSSTPCEAADVVRSPRPVRLEGVRRFLTVISVWGIRSTVIVVLPTDVLVAHGAANRRYQLV